MSSTTPFAAIGASLELREALLLLDFYMKRGAPAPTDADVIALTGELNNLANRHAPARTADEVSEVLRSCELIGAQVTRIPETVLGNVWNEYAGDEQALADAAQSVAEGHSVPTTLEPGAVTIQKIAVEALRTPQFRTSAGAGEVQFRRRQLLLKQFEAFLKSAGHAVVAHRYLIPGQTRSLQSDAFDETSNVLYAASGSVTRDSIRMAIGELSDLVRLESAHPMKAILLPRKPSGDFLRLLDACAIAVVWRDEIGFSHSDAHRLW